MGLISKFRNTNKKEEGMPNPFEPVDIIPQAPMNMDVEDFVKEEVVAEESVIAAPEPVAEGKMVLRTDNLVKKYGKRTVVNHVSIDVTQ